MSSFLLYGNRIALRFSKLSHSTLSIPNKKVRSPTALLQALANTVEWDPTSGAPYHYIDDPHTLPKTRNEKKEFTLSQASGRISARWFLQTYPWLFESVEAEPKVPAFTAPRHADSPPEGADPPILGKKKNYEQRRQERRQLAPSWNNLEVLLSERRTADAWTMWQALTGEKSKGCPDEHKNLAVDLFSLLAHSNLAPKSGSNTSAVATMEHRYYGNSYDQVATSQGQIGSRWHTEGPADQLFTWLEGKKWTEKAEYCILIRGLLRHGDRDRAREIYNTKVRPNADVDTFIDLIVAAGQTGPASADPRLQAVVDLMKDFKEAGHAPCIEIFRSAIMATAFCARNKFGQEFAFKVLAEMAKVQLNPADSPALIAALLEVFYPTQNSSPNGFLPVLLSFLETSFKTSSPSASVQHPKDRDLASTFMLKACDIFRDADMAVRIHNLLSTYRPGLLLFADVNRETAYFASLLSTLASGDTVDRLMEIYHSVVPSRWLPTPIVFVQIVDAVELQQHFDLLPNLWQEAAKMRLPYGFPVLTERFAAAIERAATSQSLAKTADPELYNSLASMSVNMVDHAEYTEVARLTRGVTLSPVGLSALFKLAMNEKVAPNSALALCLKMAALCQRLHLSSSTILSQRRREGSDEKTKKPQEVLAYFSKLAETNEKTLPPSFETWLKGDDESSATGGKEEASDAVGHSHPPQDRPSRPRFAARRRPEQR